MKKQGGHIITEETVTSFTKEKAGGQCRPRKWIIMGWDISGKKRVFLFTGNRTEEQNKQCRWSLFFFSLVKLDKMKATLRKTNKVLNRRGSEANLWRWKWKIFLWSINKLEKGQTNLLEQMNKECTVNSQKIIWTDNKTYENIYHVKICQGHTN